MTKKADFILQEALSMNPDERAMIAHCLISSLEEPINKNVDREWIKLAEKRLDEIEKGKVEPVTWNDIKKKILK